MKEESGLQLPKRKRNPDDGELDITPMIDITFLLLAFFVVASKMDPQAAIELPKASYGVSVPEKAAVTLLVTLDEGGQYKIFKGKSEDNPVAASDPEGIEDEIAQFVQNELGANPEKTSILIKAAGEVKTGTVEMVRRGVAGSEMAAERKVFVGVKEEQ
ncbi:ExbD/TolR family protein [Mariniblastus fucicola]|uniref:Biopolymer transport protein ExbD/TolR n=1 Tax=Mariniblastus fucicola TaxID=980251 RepID=A0A5B9P628_9BACT|nr:biopolymer transporter ExbD [Mariniblastus fucicola]QEG20635.1 Biopolymer transport protein ExbD/TolR [Mariniblastus fucicola]